METIYHLQPAELLKCHLSFVRGRHLQGFIDIEKVILLTVSAWVESPSWNHAIFFDQQSLNKANIDKIERACKLVDRKPAFYIINHSKNEITNLTASLGYEHFDTEYWMLQTVEKVLFQSVPQIEIVLLHNSSDTDVELFLNLYQVAFSTLTKGYSNQLYISIMSENEREIKAIHMYALFRGLPAGIASCYFSRTTAGIYNLAVVPQFQHRGIGRQLIQAAISYIGNYGCKNIFLQADINSKKFYENLGFIHVLSGQIFTKV